MHRILSEVVSNFPNSLDEVTMTVEAAGVKLKNYVEEMEGGSIQLHSGSTVVRIVCCVGDDSRVSLTEISLTPAEFDGYRISFDLSLTFCLKELRVGCRNHTHKKGCFDKVLT